MRHGLVASRPRRRKPGGSVSRGVEGHIRGGAERIACLCSGKLATGSCTPRTPAQGLPPQAKSSRRAPQEEEPNPSPSRPPDGAGPGHSGAQPRRSSPLLRRSEQLKDLGPNSPRRSHRERVNGTTPWRMENIHLVPAGRPLPRLQSQKPPLGSATQCHGIGAPTGITRDRIAAARRKQYSKW
jgi:hypothetical protein